MTEIAPFIEGIIRKADEVGQTVGVGSNLGGPTSHILADEEKALNVEWAKRYEELNGGASE